MWAYWKRGIYPRREKYLTRLMRALLKEGILTKRVHKIRMLNQTITEGSESPFQLLTCDDEPNYDLTTDGTNVSECHPGAKIIAVQLVATIYGLVATRLVEWVIGRDPDSAITNANYTMANLYASDVTGTSTMLRPNVWGAGHVVATDRSGFETRLNITGALRRASKMRDGDVIKINFTDDGAGTGNGILYLRGRIITVGP